MPEIARIDEHGTITSVEACHGDDHKTCPIARTVALPQGHDMHARAKGYSWDFGRGCFLPLSAEPLDAAERDTAELVEGLVQAIEHIGSAMQIELPKLTRRALNAYRRHTARKREEDGQ